MDHTRISATVIPVFDTPKAPYLSTLVKRDHDLTTLIWGWKGKAGRMKAPAELIKRQALVPFLFRATDQEDRQVTHAAVTGYIVHRTDAEYQTAAAWLRDHRIEKFAGLSGWGDNAETYYVVTACHVLPKPIPYAELVLSRAKRALSPDKARGYAVVFLPNALAEWFEHARRVWHELESSLPQAAA